MYPLSAYMRRAVLRLVALIAAAAAPSTALADDILIVAGRLVMPDKSAALNDVELLIRDGRIVEIGKQLSASARRVDLSRFTVLPGMIDAHTHLTLRSDFTDITDELKRTPASVAFDSIPNARAKLTSGFTTVREAGSYWAFVDVALRDAIDRGQVVGPRILASGAFLTMAGGAGALTGFGPSVELPVELRYGEANSPEEVRFKVRQLSSHGADVIKTFGSGAVIQHGNSPESAEFTPAELAAAVEEARNLGLKVMAHAHSATGIKNAVRAGVASIEHGSGLDDEAIRLMKASGTFLVPTLSVWDCTGKGDAPVVISSPEFRERSRNLVARHRAGFTKAVRNGVMVALGSDSGVCGPSTAYRELQEMVKYGMTPMQALQAATSNAAELLGLSDVGVIAPGMFADVIAVEGDPTVDINVMADVRFVMKGGTIYKQ